jgi:hypothetical protein
MTDEEAFAVVVGVYEPDSDTVGVVTSNLASRRIECVLR